MIVANAGDPRVVGLVERLLAARAGGAARAEEAARGGGAAPRRRGGPRRESGARPGSASSGTSWRRPPARRLARRFRPTGSRALAGRTRHAVHAGAPGRFGEGRAAPPRQGERRELPGRGGLRADPGRADRSGRGGRAPGRDRLRPRRSPVAAVGRHPGGRLVQLEPRSGAVGAGSGAPARGAGAASPSWATCSNWAPPSAAITGSWAATPRNSASVWWSASANWRPHTVAAAREGRRGETAWFEDARAAGAGVPPLIGDGDGVVLVKGSRGGGAGARGRGAGPGTGAGPGEA